MSSARTPRHSAAAALPAPPRTPAPRPHPPTHPPFDLFISPPPHTHTAFLPPYPRVGLSTRAFACAPEGPAAPFPPPRHAAHTRGCCPADAQQGERGVLHVPPLHTHSGGCTVHACTHVSTPRTLRAHPTCTSPRHRPHAPTRALPTRGWHGTLWPHTPPCTPSPSTEVPPK